MPNDSDFTLEYAGFSHVGMKRDHNEDSFSLVPENNLFITADGMGGHNSGEIASKMATETVANFFKATQYDDEITWPYKYEKSLSEAENRLRTSIRLANSRIWETSQRNDLYHGMGTTVVSVYFEGPTATIANVGDSRCYILRNRQLTQITIDHSLLNDYLKYNDMTEEQIKNFPHKNVIVRALGIKEDVEVDLFKVAPVAGDVFLLCSDGLTDLVNDAEIADILSTEPDIKNASKLLVRAANQYGGVDNSTTVLVKVE